MFDHVTLRATDRAASEAFFDTVLAPLEISGRHAGAHSTLFGNFELSIAQASDQRPTTRHAHLGLRARSRAAVDAFWQAGVNAGYRSDGDPGPRPQYVADYYGAFLLDPDGNSIEACVHERARERGLIDHVWVRTADLAAARGTYERLAEHAGLTVPQGDDTLLRLRGPQGGSLTIVQDGAATTTGLHLAVPAAQPAIDAWHAAATAAGDISDGAPGPRPYHPQYYGAFVLDAGGRSLELVDHGGLLGERW